MNILMLNPVHPSVPHISGVRAWRFAQELASFGHRVMFITAPTQSQAPGTVADIEAHDWSSPLVVPCGQPNRGKLAVPANAFARKVVTAMRLLRDGGVDAAWCRDAVRMAVQSRWFLEPDVVWCTFGNGEAVVAAKRIAKALGKPWVLDIKDNWEIYVPRGLRHLMARRTKGWSCVTTNAQLTADMATKWQKTSAKIVYSGVEAAFYPTPEDRKPDSAFVLNLVGSVYSNDHLECFLEGVRLWHQALPHEQRECILFRYLGADVDRVNTMAKKMLPTMLMDIQGYVPVGDFARHCVQAGANAYIAYTDGFHHKLLELLATARPVIAFPDERQESIDLSRASGTVLHIAHTKQDLAEVLSFLYAQYRLGTSAAELRAATGNYSWVSQARMLEQVLADSIKRNSSNG